MTNYKTFEGYWNEACNSTIYYLRNLDTPVIGKNKVNEIWRRELLENRFMCGKEYVHGAKLFLDELMANDPETGVKVVRLLNNSEFDIGCRSTDMAVGGGLGAVAATVGTLSSGSDSKKKDKNSKNVIAGALSSALVLVAGATVAKSAYDGSKEVVIKNFSKKSKQRLEVFKRVLG